MFTRSPHLSPLLVVTALASAGAGIVHAAVAPEHTNWGASVAFFVALAVFQIGWAAYVLARAPGTTALALGAAVNLLAVATWAVSRTSGLPFGPHQGAAEPAARADLIACALGLLVALAAPALARQGGRQPVARVRSALSVGAGGLAVSALSVFALTGVSGHSHLAGAEHDHAAPLEVQAVSCDRAAVGCPGASATPVEQVESDASHPDDGHTH